MFIKANARELSTKTRTEKHPVDLLVWKSQVTRSGAVSVVWWLVGKIAAAAGRAEPCQWATIKEQPSCGGLKSAGAGREGTESSSSGLRPGRRKSAAGKVQARVSSGAMLLYSREHRRRTQLKTANPSLGALYTLNFNLHKNSTKYIILSPFHR